MVEYGRVPRKGRIRATIEKLSGRVSKKGRISVTTRNCASTEKRTDEYRKKVESV